MTWLEAPGGVGAALNRYDRYYSGGSERDRFVTAFKVLIDRGEFPSPGALNREQGHHTRRSIPGRLTGLRMELLTEAGYHFDKVKRRWVK